MKITDLKALFIGIIICFLTGPLVLLFLLGGALGPQTGIGYNGEIVVIIIFEAVIFILGMVLMRSLESKPVDRRTFYKHSAYYALGYILFFSIILWHVLHS